MPHAWTPKMNALRGRLLRLPLLLWLAGCAAPSPPSPSLAPTIPELPSDARPIEPPSETFSARALRNTTLWQATLTRRSPTPAAATASASQTTKR